LEDHFLGKTPGTHNGLDSEIPCEVSGFQALDASILRKAKKNKAVQSIQKGLFLSISG